MAPRGEPGTTDAGERAPEQIRAPDYAPPLWGRQLIPAASGLIEPIQGVMEHPKRRDGA